MRVLAVGDVCNSEGCEKALKFIPKIKREENIDFIIVNGENSADGNGVTPQSAKELFAAGAHVITGGNHSLRRKEIIQYLDEQPFLLRPHNIPCETGSGYCLVDLGRFSVAVINLSGQMYLEQLKAENPFKEAERLVEKAKSDGAKFIFVDFHAETTSEKRAMGFFLDGKVTAVFGTHTHVQTSDAQILPNGTGYVTDIGMTGVVDSVLGVKKEIIIDRLKNSNFAKFEKATGESMLNACIFDCDDTSGLVNNVKLINV